MRILLVEDDPELRAYIEEQLVLRGCAVDAVEDFSLFDKSKFDLYIIDRMLGSQDSLVKVSALRKNGDATPCLFLTAMGSIQDKVDGLHVADDYLVKPFDMDELYARLLALHRRSHVEQTAEVTIGNIRIDHFQRVAYVASKKLQLKPMEFKLLEFLLASNGTVISRRMLLEKVWGITFDPATNIVDAYISRLRRHLNAENASCKIETVRGKGYRFEAHT